MSNFAARCDDRTFDNDKGCEVARCDSRVYCFDSYLILSRKCEVIMRRHFLWHCMETDEEELLAGHFLMQFNATVVNYYFTVQLRA